MGFVGWFDAHHADVDHETDTTELSLRVSHYTKHLITVFPSYRVNMIKKKKEGGVETQKNSKESKQ